MLITVPVRVADLVFDQELLHPRIFKVPRQVPCPGKSLPNTAVTTCTCVSMPAPNHCSRAGENFWENSRRCSWEPGEAPTTKAQPWRSIKHQGDCQHQQLIAAEGCQRADTDIGAKAAEGKRGGCLCGCHFGRTGRQI